MKSKWSDTVLLLPTSEEPESCCCYTAFLEHITAALGPGPPLCLTCSSWHKGWWSMSYSFSFWKAAYKKHGDRAVTYDRQWMVLPNVCISEKLMKTDFSTDKHFFTVQHGSSSAAGTAGWWLSSSMVTHTEVAQLYHCFDTGRTWSKLAFLSLIRNNSSSRNFPYSPDQDIKIQHGQEKKKPNQKPRCSSSSLETSCLYQVENKHFSQGLQYSQNHFLVLLPITLCNNDRDQTTKSTFPLKRMALWFRAGKQRRAGSAGWLYHLLMLLLGAAKCLVLAVSKDINLCWQYSTQGEMLEVCAL